MHGRWAMLGVAAALALDAAPPAAAPPPQLMLPASLLAPAALACVAAAELLRLHAQRRRSGDACAEDADAGCDVSSASSPRLRVYPGGRFDFLGLCGSCDVKDAPALSFYCSWVSGGALLRGIVRPRALSAPAQAAMKARELRAGRLAMCVRASALHARASTSAKRARAHSPNAGLRSRAAWRRSWPRVPAL